MRANLDCGAGATLEARGPDAEEAVQKLSRIVREMRDYE
jgi:phosphotransferase system HPr-like phosphotransfer protein